MHYHNKSLSEAHGEPLPLPIPAFYELLRHASIKDSSKIALVCLHQSPDFLSSVVRSQPSDYLRWTYAELMRASHAFAKALAGAGIRPGMRIAAFVTNGVEFHIALRAALELNCIFAPLNPKTAFNAAETKHTLELLEPNVVLVEEASIAKKLEDSSYEIMKTVSVKLLSPVAGEMEAALSGWRKLTTFVEAAKDDGILERLNIVRKEDDVILVLMTSGTTSLPKGCPHTNRSLGAMGMAYVQNADFDNTRVSCCHVPVFHVFGIAYGLYYQLAGLKIVHPAATFDPGSTLKAIRLERCSDMGGVLPIVHAILAHPDFKNTDTSCLKHVHLGSTTILPETIRMSVEQLGSLKASEAYGMTECAGSATVHRYRDLGRHVPEIVTAGKPLAGSKIRVCKPGTRELVPRGQPGECHIGGLIIIDKYWLRPLSKPADDTFYTDDEGTWIVTGDKAIMDEKGELQIVGRYKDMIIRGGENISPSAIESIIFTHFGLTAEVIGVPDEIAGEVPVAVVKSEPGEAINLLIIRETLVRELGSIWVPDEFISIESIGVEDYPRTASGKVQKDVLRDLVMKKRRTHDGVSSDERILDVLIKLWTKLLGVSPGTVTPETSMHDWADSLVLSRFSAILHRQTGQLISLYEISENDTPAAQAKLLSSRGTSAAQTISDIRPKREGPPTVTDMVHAHGDTGRAQRTQTMCNETLAPLGLTWDDVEDVIPMNGFQENFLKKRRPQSNNHRHAWLCPGSTVSTLQIALEKVLSHHSILRTMAVYFDEKTSLHIIIRPTEKWFSSCFTFVDDVNSAEDLSTLVYNDPKLDYAAFPGPLFRFVLTQVKDENCAGLVYMAQHSIFDGISLPIFLEDLNDLLAKPGVSLKDHVPYKAWADSFYMLQDSPIARQSIAWQVKRLSGIASNPAALFPIQRVPEWFKGDSTSWIDVSTNEPGPTRKSLDANPIGVKGIIGQGTLRDIQTLKAKHGVEGSQIVKAALAIVTSQYTKQPYALFGQAQAGRAWPFLLEWQASRMPPVMDVDGPAVQGTLNLIPLYRNETILHMLKRLQAEQQDLNKHAYAPMNQLVAALNEGNTKDGDFMRDAFKRQIFNWLPTSPMLDFEKLKRAQIESRTDCGILWNCIMMDQTTLQINPTWDDAQLMKVEVEKMLEEILKTAAAFATEANWENHVSQFT